MAPVVLEDGRQNEDEDDDAEERVAMETEQVDDAVDNIDGVR